MELLNCRVSWLLLDWPEVKPSNLQAERALCYLFYLKYILRLLRLKSSNITGFYANPKFLKTKRDHCLLPTTADTPAAWTCPLLSGQEWGFAHWVTGSSQPLLVFANVTGRAHHPEYIAEVSRTNKNLQPTAHWRADWFLCFRWVCQPLN